jgi:nitroreductase
MKTSDILSPTADAGLFNHIVHRRRAAQGFTGEDVPSEVIDAALQMASQAPSGYNFQPWRFLVLRDAGRRATLRQAAFDQAKITEAPVVIVAYARRDHWRDRVDDILATAARYRGIPLDKVPRQKQSALAFVDAMDPAVWLNRHVMIAFTYLMLAFEFLGWDTAPMEGFDAAKVRAGLGLPEDAEPVALLAVGRNKDTQTPHPGRLPVAEIAFDEQVGAPWRG